MSTRSNSMYAMGNRGWNSVNIQICAIMPLRLNHDEKQGGLIVHANEQPILAVHHATQRQVIRTTLCVGDRHAPT